MSASREDIQKLVAAVQSNPQTEIVVDVAAKEVRFAGQKIPVTIRDSARDALINGRWDAIGELLEGIPVVKTFTAKLPYLSA